MAKARKSGDGKLGDYRRRRDFGSTPEPKPRKRSGRRRAPLATAQLARCSLKKSIVRCQASSAAVWS